MSSKPEVFVRMVAELALWSWAMMESEVRKEGLTLDIKRDEDFSETREEDERVCAN